MLIALMLAGAPPQTRADLNEQAAAAAARADAAMNVQYRATMAFMRQMDGLHEPDARVGPTYQDALLASQRAWRRFRDAECVVEGYRFRGGSAQGMTGARCRATLAQARTRQLSAMADRP